MNTARALAATTAELALERMAEDVVVLDLTNSSVLADYFVLATADTTQHARGIAESIEQRLRQMGQRPHHVEGAETGQWVILDYFSVVVHIFLGHVRSFYGLERLWGDVPTDRHTR